MNSSKTGSEDRMFQLSGIQNYVFCPRQWALHYLEQIWTDNRLTVEGSLLHDNVDNPFHRETDDSGVITLRGLRLESPRIGLSGIADAVEIHPFEDAPAGKRNILKSGMFNVLPVEYKRGKTKTSDCDRLQVTAQACILEEMLGVRITKGAIFYWETRQREYFDITPELRRMVQMTVDEMHQIEDSGQLPPAVKAPHCRSCSVVDSCMPGLSGKSARRYIRAIMDNLNHNTL